MIKVLVTYGLDIYTRQMNYACHKNREKLIMQLKYNNNDVVEIKATNSS